MLEPGKHIRPNVDLELATNILMEFYGMEVLEIKEMASYDDRNFYVKSRRVNSCYRKSEQSNSSSKTISCSQESGEFVLKILNSIDSAETGHIDAEHDMRELLLRSNYICPATLTNLSNEYKSFVTLEKTSEDGVIRSEKYAVRLLTFIPGEILATVPSTTHLFVSVGRYLADLQQVIKNVDHPGLLSGKSTWKLESVPMLKTFLEFLSSLHKQEVIRSVIEAFEQNVLPFTNDVERGAIHGDFNEWNIIVQQRESKPDEKEIYEVSAVIDFADASVTCLVFDLALTVTYMMIQNKGACSDFVEVGGYVLGGYMCRRPLTDLELKILPYCVMARYAQSLVIGEYTYKIDPSNVYVLSSAVEGWRQLDVLVSQGAEEVLRKWLRVAGTLHDRKAYDFK